MSHFQSLSLCLSNFLFPSTDLQFIFYYLYIHCPLSCFCSCKYFSQSQQLEAAKHRFNLAIIADEVITAGSMSTTASQQLPWPSTTFHSQLISSLKLSSSYRTCQFLKHKSTECYNIKLCALDTKVFILSLTAIGNQQQLSDKHLLQEMNLLPIPASHQSLLVTGTCTWK